MSMLYLIMACVLCVVQSTERPSNSTIGELTEFVNVNLYILETAICNELHAFDKRISVFENTTLHTKSRINHLVQFASALRHDIMHGMRKTVRLFNLQMKRACK